MELITDRIDAFSEDINYESLMKFASSIDFDELDYESHLPTPAGEGDYGRNVIRMDPFECVLIHWPAGIESGIHDHNGLYGCVQVLEGEIENVCYNETESELQEIDIQHFSEGDLVPEPDEAIHKIRNASNTKRAVTVHFYNPPLRTLDGVRIFDTESGSIGVLSKDAETATWSEEDGHFKSVKEDTFEFICNDDLLKREAHADN